MHSTLDSLIKFKNINFYVDSSLMKINKINISKMKNNFKSSDKRLCFFVWKITYLKIEQQFFMNIKQLDNLTSQL